MFMFIQYFVKYVFKSVTHVCENYKIYNDFLEKKKKWQQAAKQVLVIENLLGCGTN